MEAELPPAIVFFGNEDKWFKVGWKQATQKINSLGIKSTEVLIAKGQGHGFFNKQPWADLTFIEADKFLNQHGLIKGDPTLAAPKTGETLVRQ